MSKKDKSVEAIVPVDSPPISDGRDLSKDSPNVSVVPKDNPPTPH